MPWVRREVISPSNNRNGKRLGFLPERSAERRLEMDERHEIQVGSRPGSGDEADSLAERIGSLLEGKFCGRVQQLQVVCSEGRLILKGRCRTYYAKQLAHQAVLEETGGYPLLVNQIMVS
jgi:hypothetical protein